MSKSKQIEIQVGLFASSPESLSVLRQTVLSTGMARLNAESALLPDAEQKTSLVHFDQEPLDVLLIETSDPTQILETLRVVHASLPRVWKLVISEAGDSQLIIEAVRAGAREFLPRPLSTQALSQAFQRYIEEQHREVKELPKGKIFWVTSAKGGSGATSIAINLATAIHSLDRSRVALVDLNMPVGDTAAYLNLRPEFTVNNAFEAGERLDPVLLESFVNTTHGISILSGPKSFQAEQQNPEDLRRLLRVAARTYEWTLVDFPCFVCSERITLMAELCDSILVVLNPELPALWRTHRLLDFINQSHLENKLHLILNRFDKKGEITRSEIEKTLGRDISWTLPNDYRAVIEAINTGHPLVTTNHSALAGSFDQLAQAITGIRPGKKKKGFLGLFS